MALFTNKADADLPLLTQFYQVAVPGERDAGSLRGSELELFLERCEEKEKDPLTILTTGKLPKNQRRNRKEQIPDHFLTDAADIHDLVCILMDSLAEDEFIQISTVKQIEKYIDKYNESIRIGFSQFGWIDVALIPEDYPPGELIKAKHLRVIKRRSNEDAPEGILGVLDEVEKLLSSRRMYWLSSCEECYSVFIQERNVSRRGEAYATYGSKQRFCSHRCASRSGQRRRRAKAHEKWKEGEGP